MLEILIESFFTINNIYKKLLLSQKKSGDNQQERLYIKEARETSPKNMVIILQMVKFLFVPEKII